MSQPGRLISDAFRNLLKGQPLLCTSGTQKRDFLHVEDVANAFVELMFREDIRGPINIASGDSRTVREVVFEVASIIGRQDLLQIGAKQGGATEPPELVGSVRRLREELRVCPKYS